MRSGARGSGMAWGESPASINLGQEQDPTIAGDVGPAETGFDPAAVKAWKSQLISGTLCHQRSSSWLLSYHLQP